MKKTLFFFAIPLLLNPFTADSVSGSSVMQSDSLVSINNIRQDIETLTSDSLQGRATASQYEKKTAIYVAQKMKDLGAEPLIDHSYIQTFKLDKITIAPESRASFLSADKGMDSMRLNSNFIFLKGYMNGKMENTLDVVYAGYGISENERDDYKDLDVKGKVALVLSDLPPGLHHNNLPDARNIFAVMNYKAASAQRQGALGIIFIADSFYTGLWEFLIAVLTKVPEFRFPGTVSQQFFAAIVRPDAFSKFMEPSLKQLKVNFSYSIKSEPVESYNVIGVLEGKDPELRNEFVVLGAHHDHLGIIDGKIYRGADDNATGVASVLETGRILKKLNSNKRSVILITHGAEEALMLGSEYFISYFDGIKNISAMINIDMVGRESRDSLYSVYYGRLGEEMKNILEEANKTAGKFSINYSLSDPYNPEKILYRSDQSSYAQKEIPAVVLFDYMSSDLHQAADTPDKINFEKVAKVVDLSSHMILRISNLDHKVKVTTR